MFVIECTLFTASSYFTQSQYKHTCLWDRRIDLYRKINANYDQWARSLGVMRQNVHRWTQALNVTNLRA